MVRKKSVEKNNSRRNLVVGIVVVVLILGFVFGNSITGNYIFEDIFESFSDETSDVSCEPLTASESSGITRSPIPGEIDAYECFTDSYCGSFIDEGYLGCDDHGYCCPIGEMTKDSNGDIVCYCQDEGIVENDPEIDPPTCTDPDDVTIFDEFAAFVTNDEIDVCGEEEEEEETCKGISESCDPSEPNGGCCPTVDDDDPTAGGAQMGCEPNSMRCTPLCYTHPDGGKIACSLEGPPAANWCCPGNKKCSPTTPGACDTGCFPGEVICGSTCCRTSGGNVCKYDDGTDSMVCVRPSTTDPECETSGDYYCGEKMIDGEVKNKCCFSSDICIPRPVSEGGAVCQDSGVEYCSEDNSVCSSGTYCCGADCCNDLDICSNDLPSGSPDVGEDRCLSADGFDNRDRKVCAVEVVGTSINIIHCPDSQSCIESGGNWYCDAVTPAGRATETTVS